MYSTVSYYYCYCIGYTSNDWSTSTIPLYHYQEGLQESIEWKSTLQERRIQERELQLDLYTTI